MSVWVIENDWTIYNITKPIPALRIELVGNNRIRLNESPQLRRIESCAVIHDPTHAIVQFALTGVGEVRAEEGRVGNRPRRAEGEIALLTC